MIWIIIVHLVVLATFAFFGERWKDRGPIRRALIWFALGLLVQAFFTLFRAGMWEGRKLVLVEIWSNGFHWFFLALSLLALTGLLKGESGER